MNMRKRYALMSKRKGIGNPKSSSRTQLMTKIRSNLKVSCHDKASRHQCHFNTFLIRITHCLKEINSDKRIKSRKALTKESNHKQEIQTREVSRAEYSTPLMGYH
jgi:hypothetical protein